MNIIEKIILFFQTGGFFMYPILFVLALGCAIGLERWIKLMISRRTNVRAWNQIQPMLEEGRFDDALEFSNTSAAPISKILSYGLSRRGSVRRRDDIEIAMEEGMMEIAPQLEKRTHYLATFANMSTLLGLLGTIIGLIQAFTAVANANPAEKADLLSASIAVAMNTTAFGLIAGIPLLLLHALLSTKTSGIIDSLEMASVKTLNLITEFSRREREEANG